MIMGVFVAACQAQPVDVSQQVVEYAQANGQRELIFGLNPWLAAVLIAIPVIVISNIFRKVITSIGLRTAYVYYNLISPFTAAHEFAHAIAVKGLRGTVEEIVILPSYYRGPDESGYYIVEELDYRPH
ncbi:unnamed protein product, partial [marine sediment metagenome]